MVPGAHKRLPNGILGLLCREHFPGLVRYAEALEPAYTYEHYVAAPDAEDETGRTYESVAERVMCEFWDFFKCAEGYEARAAKAAAKSFRGRISDMHYEARLQAIIDYCAVYEQRKVKKEDARLMHLTKEQYLKVPPRLVRQ
ncbi:uncharacterized protein [Miscanthus floridulus]|uniref:uncharacterized protein n=1 Tax=Miscanthus floridulus TaxID=154761 RepID=UPI00345B0A5C